MPFIERGQGNKIIGLYNVAQPGRTNNEQLPNDDVEVLEFKNRNIGTEPMTAEEVWEILETKGLVNPADRLRPKPQDARP